MDVTAEQVEIERLREELQHAHSQLKAKEEKLTLAASYGVKLLNENKTLAEQHEAMVHEKDELVQSLEEELHRLKGQAKQHAAEQEYVTDLEAENERIRRECDSWLKKAEAAAKERKELKDEIARLRNAETDADDRARVLEAKIKQQEARIQELEEQVQCSFKNDTMDEEFANAQAEIARLRGILSKLQMEKTESENMLSQLQQRYASSEELVADLRNVVEDKSEALKTARDDAERARTELQMVQAKLDSYQSSNGEMGAGLDLFSEVEDKRQALEDAVAQMKRQVSRVRKRCELAEQQRKQLQARLSVVTQLQSSKADESKLLRLEQALSQARSESHTQQRQLKKLQQQLDQSSHLLRSQHAAADGNSDNAYVQFLQTELDEKTAQIRRLTNEVQTKAFLCISESRKVREYESQLHEAERRNEQLTVEMMEKDMKLEEHRMMLEMAKVEAAAAAQLEAEEEAKQASKDKDSGAKQKQQQQSTRQPLGDASNTGPTAATPKPKARMGVAFSSPIAPVDDGKQRDISLDISAISTSSPAQVVHSGSSAANASLRLHRRARDMRRGALARASDLGADDGSDKHNSSVGSVSGSFGGDVAVSGFASTPTSSHRKHHAADSSGIACDTGVPAVPQSTVEQKITRMKISAPAEDNSVDCNTQ
ncbi:hypothetical protein PTSG_04533 [Salpingoeca rosetta]|uniref:Uncharacterized protein n=1 Tax=Salpingoeca rosetta (strain ATCC 50818 / BSB-021) TaxID=946362 RepID=F2U7Q1_SALR5|nr:uncharacterized protein PTSG_04533 [Salpingoeca rosetta]EGD72806.1 hypothetical protein PTSG_04533 [Salpingoeca rosetta]|eukprot:XP_004994629.1 hypothetical protein PTSG_04533 [Salpingoeca rosetta]